MRILLLTPVDPTNSAFVYGQLLQTFDKKDVGIVSFPFFAETYARVNNALYLPSLFAMLNVMRNDRRAHDKIYNRSNILVVGNTYKDEKFDMIVSFGPEEDNTYIEAIVKDPQFAEFNLLAEAEKLYTWADAEINLPTIKHVKLFLEGVYKTNDSVQPKTARGN